MIEIRSGRPDEALQILQVWRDAEAEPTTTDDADRVRLLMTVNPDALVVAEDEHRLVGTAIAGWDGWRGGIYRLAVVPDHRGRGLGRRLANEAIGRLRELGAVRLSAIVVDTDERALGFWTAIGWHRQLARARFVLNL